jgi:phage terminase Nu1 subunit (DNA packaging protein)
MLVAVILNQNVFTVTHVSFTVTNIPTSMKKKGKHQRDYDLDHILKIRRSATLNFRDDKDRNS